MLITYGAIVSGASGKLAGVTFARMKGAPIIRAAGRYHNQSTPDQIAQRQAHSAAITAWRALPAYTQLAWNVYALKNQRQNRLGVWRRLTGFQFYLQEATPRIRAGLGLTGSPPNRGQQGIGTPTGLVFWQGGPYEISFNAPTADPHGYYLFTGHRPMSTISYKKPYYHVLPAQYIEHTATFDLQSDWADKMGDMQAGELFIVLVRYAGNNSLISAAATYRSTVTSP
jgi:hypothetical protein